MISKIKKILKFNNRAPTVTYNQTKFTSANYCRAYVKSGMIYISGYCMDTSGAVAGTIIAALSDVYPLTTGNNNVASFSVPCQCDDGSCDFINVVPYGTALQILTGRAVSASKYIRYTACIPSTGL